MKCQQTFKKQRAPRGDGTHCWEVVLIHPSNCAFISAYGLLQPPEYFTTGVKTLGLLIKMPAWKAGPT